MRGWRKVQGSADETIRHLLESLLTGGIVDGLLVPLRTLDDRNAVPTLIHDPALLARAAPLAPVMPINAGTALGRITATGALGRVGAVMRNCELRTAVELSKVQQVLLDNVLFIGVDCLGTCRVEDYAHVVEDGLDPAAAALAAAREGRVELLGGVHGHTFRPACSMCERPIPGVGGSYVPHITLGLLGVPNDLRLWVSLRDEQPRGVRSATLRDWPEGRGAKPVEPLVECLGLHVLADRPGEPADEPDARVEAVEALVAVRTAERDRRFAAFGERVRDPLSLLSEFATCIRCQNCMVTCPICYCKECIFRTDIFDHPSPRYWDWAERKGGVRLPSDTLLFHVTRMLHMAHACVGCGMCSDACPVGIPVADIFRAVGQRVQESFGYVPGRDPDEEMIIATFREDELSGLGKPG